MRCTVHQSYQKENYIIKRKVHQLYNIIVGEQISSTVKTSYYSLRPTLFVLFEKSIFLREHHLLSCLPFKNV